MVRHSSRIELSQSALKQNINFIRKKTGPKAIFSSVVKADAFGHGINTFVPMAEKAGVRHFSVASGYEAWEVSQACTQDSSIMIMGILYDEDLEWVINQGIEFFVFDLPRLRKAKKVAEDIGKRRLSTLKWKRAETVPAWMNRNLILHLQFLKRTGNFFNLKGSVLTSPALNPCQTSSASKNNLKNLNSFIKRPSIAGLLHN